MSIPSTLLYIPSQLDLGYPPPRHYCLKFPSRFKNLEIYKRNQKISIFQGRIILQIQSVSVNSRARIRQTLRGIFSLAYDQASQYFSLFRVSALCYFGEDFITALWITLYFSPIWMRILRHKGTRVVNSGSLFVNRL